MAAVGHLSVAAVLLLSTFVTDPVLSQDVTPPQLFSCSDTDIAGALVTSNLQTGIASYNVPTAFNLDGIGDGPSNINLYNKNPRDAFPYGFTTVGYQFIDNRPPAPQNSGFCTFFVQIGISGDINPPVVDNCPISGFTQPISPFQNTINVNWVEPTATDNNLLVRRSFRSHAPNSAFPVGMTTVTYQWIDPRNFGQPTQCTFPVTVTTTGQGTDDSMPAVTCPTNVVAGSNGVATWTTPTPTDASGTPSITPTMQPGSVFNEGFTKVTYNVRDASGNRASCSFYVRRRPSADIYPPVITSCPENIQRNGNTDTLVTWTEPTVYDDSSHTRLVFQTHSSNTLFPVGTTPVEYRFTDAALRIARCVFTVRITPNQGPCSPSPCLNGGNCFPAGSTFFCQCATGFTGNTCGTPIGPCSTSPCLNGGNCFPSGSTFFCQCATGFTGNTCGTPIGGFSIACTPIVSTSGALGSTVTVSIPEPIPSGQVGLVRYFYFDPVTQITDHTAYTTPVLAAGRNDVLIRVFGFDDLETQTQCTTTIQVTALSTTSPCSSTPCNNGGVCSVTEFSFTCTCPTLWVGTICNIPNPCNSDPCTLPEVCYHLDAMFICRIPSPCSPSPCLNGGNCFPAGSTFFCQCATGFTGNTCGTPIGRRRRDTHEVEDMSPPVELSGCEDSSCANNSTCTTDVDVHNKEFIRCSCAPGWKGVRCDQVDDGMRNSDDMDHAPAPWMRERLGMHWLMVAVIAILSVVIMMMACVFLRVRYRKESRFNDVKLVH